MKEPSLWEEAVSSLFWPRTPNTGVILICLECEIFVRQIWFIEYFCIYHSRNNSNVLPQCEIPMVSPFFSCLTSSPCLSHQNNPVLIHCQQNDEMFCLEEASLWRIQDPGSVPSQVELLVLTHLNSFFSKHCAVCPRLGIFLSFKLCNPKQGSSSNFKLLEKFFKW